MPSPLKDFPAHNIALIKPSALGDIAHTLPVLSALRRRYPRARITWIVNRSFEPILQGHPHLDATLAFDRGALRGGWWRGVTTFARFLRKLRQQKFDLAIDLQGLLRSGLMTLATGAPRRIGLSSAREGSHLAYTDRIAVPPSDMHAVDRYWLAAEALGCQEPKEFHLPIQPEAAAWAETLLRGRARPWVAVTAGARWLTKRWPPEHFAELLRRGWQQTGGTAILLGGPEEAELSRAVRTRLEGPALDLTGTTTLPQLVALLARVDVVLANDTGPLHLAVALGRPVVAPYTCTRVALTGPYGQAGRAVATGVWCAGSLCKQCSRLECLAELTPDRLWPVLREVLARWQRGNLSA